jgi:hypothetical protein
LGLDERDAAGEPGAVALAHAARRACGSTHGLAVLIDPPGGPWVAIASAEGADTRRLRYTGQDRRARTWSAVVALEFLRRSMLGLAAGWAA